MKKSFSELPSSFNKLKINLYIFLFNKFIFYKKLRNNTIFDSERIYFC